MLLPALAQDADEAAAALFAGPGEMRARCRALDWSATPLGPVAGWPASLRAAVGICLGSCFPMSVLWGPELVLVYNDAHRSTLRGGKHPGALGRPAREAWAELWEQARPKLERILAGGPADWHEDDPLAIARGGRTEVAYFTYSLSPIPDDAGAVGGVLNTAIETTARVRAEERLRQSEARARALVANLPGGAAFVVDHDLRYVLAEGEALHTAGLSSADLVGRTIAEALGPETAAAYEPFYRRALTGDVFAREHEDHGHTYVTRGVPLRDADGRVEAALAVSYDITEHARAEAALRASEARYRTLVDNVRDHAIILLDAGGVITEWTAGAACVKGYAAEEALGRHVSLFYTPEDVAAGVPARELAEAAATGRSEHEGWRVRKGGGRFWANEVVSAVRDADGRLTGFTKIGRDLTERRLAEAAAEHAQLAAARDALRRQLAAAEEAERRRLARELHDQLGQELTAFRLGLDDATRLAATHDGAHAAPDAPLLARLAQLQALAERMTSVARYVALELRPPALDDLGLESALETYVAQWSARYGVAAEVAVTGIAADRPVPPEVGSAVYRIVQEALTNVAKHAHASQVSVIVEKPDGEVRIIVEDDGRGFDPDATAERVRRERRLGLAGMRERAALAGGTVAVESSPGVGTTLYVRLPVEPAPPAAGGMADGPDADAAAPAGADV